MITAEIATPESRAAESTSNNNERKSKQVAQVDGTRTVVLRPPRKVAPADDIVEDEANDRPRHVVDGGGRWNETRPIEDDGEVHIAQYRVWPHPRSNIPKHGQCDAQHEKEHEPVIDLTTRELTLWADDAPDDARGAKHLRRGAAEPVALARAAHILDVRKHPRLHTELRGAREDARDDLAPEHCPRRHLHVVAQLEVRCELKRLGHRDVAPCFEKHHRDGTAGEHVPNDEFRDNVQPNLLIRDGLDHAHGDHVDKGDDLRVRDISTQQLYLGMCVPKLA